MRREGVKESAMRYAEHPSSDAKVDVRAQTGSKLQ